MALVVVFGAGGRLGRRVTVEAADRGHHVIGVVHREAVALLGQGVETVEGDVTDLVTVRRVSQSADAQGRFGISYEDYAVALVDEIDHPRHHRRRFTVGY